MFGAPPQNPYDIFWQEQGGVRGLRTCFFVRFVLFVRVPCGKNVDPWYYNFFYYPPPGANPDWCTDIAIPIPSGTLSSPPHTLPSHHRAMAMTIPICRMQTSSSVSGRRSATAPSPIQMPTRTSAACVVCICLAPLC